MYWLCKVTVWGLFFVFLLIDRYRVSLSHNNSKKWLPQAQCTYFKESYFASSYPPLWLDLPGYGSQRQQKPSPFCSEACPPSSVSSQPPLTPSLPQCRLGWEEQAETPHQPRWLAANQLQPKVIGSRWETFWWRKQGEQVASWKEEEKKQVQSPRGMKREAAECKLFGPAGRAILEC